MEIKVIATTVPGVQATKEQLDIFGGRSAGVCYMSGSFDDLCNEDVAKTERRIRQTKQNGHHSVYDHSSISLYLENVPKIILMILNNEKQYSTSEKSARYTKMTPTPKEQLLYDKWLEIFKTKITKLYADDYPSFFSPSRIEKLAQENARYLLSVFTPANMIYTTSYRQINNLIAMFDVQIAKENLTPFEEKLKPILTEFVGMLKSLPYYDKNLSDNQKHRHLSLFSDKNVEEYFGDVYSTNYMCSFACLAQLQRHRTIWYSMTPTDSFYVPEIIKDSPSFTELWLSDLKDLADLYPQGTLLNVHEMGNFDAFVLKLKERKCTMAQLEINKVTIATLENYSHALNLKNHPRAEEMSKYTHGSRCKFPDFVCTSPCGFLPGINETRKI